MLLPSRPICVAVALSVPIVPRRSKINGCSIRRYNSRNLQSAIV
jgi:hypothetical protein